MEVEELSHGWTGSQIYDLKLASDLYKLGIHDKFIESNISNYLFYMS